MEIKYFIETKEVNPPINYFNTTIFKVDFGQMTFEYVNRSSSSTNISGTISLSQVDYHEVEDVTIMIDLSIRPDDTTRCTIFLDHKDELIKRVFLSHTPIDSRTTVVLPKLFKLAAESVTSFFASKRFYEETLSWEE